MPRRTGIRRGRRPRGRRSDLHRTEDFYVTRKAIKQALDTPAETVLATLRAYDKPLATLHAENTAPFDLIFLDADKPNNPNYLDWAIRLSHPGTVIIGDNVIRDGNILHPDDPDPTIQGTRRFLEKLGAHPQLEATAIQTVGSKGYDGFAIAIVKTK